MQRLCNNNCDDLLDMMESDEMFAAKTTLKLP